MCSLILKLDIVQGVSLPNEECSVDSLEMEDINQVSALMMIDVVVMMMMMMKSQLTM